MKNEVMRLFNEKKYSAYDIHIKLGISFKEITNYIRESEVAKARHKKVLAEQVLMSEY